MGKSGMDEGNGLAAQGRLQQRRGYELHRWHERDDWGAPHGARLQLLADVQRGAHGAARSASGRAGDDGGIHLRRHLVLHLLSRESSGWDGLNGKERKGKERKGKERK